MSRSVANGRCSICPSPARARAELLLAGGASVKAVAVKFQLPVHSLYRHWNNHVGPERRAALMFGPVQREALAAQLSEESASVIDHFRIVRSGLYTLFSAALDAGDRVSGSMIAGRLTEVNSAIAKITGQLASSPLVQNNTLNVLINDPAFASFQTDLIRALSKFPDARAAVLAEFERLETQSVALPALEHMADV